MKYILIVVFLFFISPISFRFLKIENNISSYIYFFNKLKIKIDLDKIFKNSENLKKDKILKQIKYLINTKPIIKNILKKSKVTKLSLIYKVNRSYIDQSPYINIFFWNAVANFRNFLIKNVKSLKNEYYYIENRNSFERISFEIIIKTKVIYIFLAIFINVKKFIKIINLKKEKVNK